MACRPLSTVAGRVYPLPCEILGVGIPSRISWYSASWTRDGYIVAFVSTVGPLAPSQA